MRITCDLCGREMHVHDVDELGTTQWRCDCGFTWFEDDDHHPVVDETEPENKINNMNKLARHYLNRWRQMTEELKVCYSLRLSQDRVSMFRKYLNAKQGVRLGLIPNYYKYTGRRN